MQCIVPLKIYFLPTGGLARTKSITSVSEMDSDGQAHATPGSRLRPMFRSSTTGRAIVIVGSMGSFEPMDF